MPPLPLVRASHLCRHHYGTAVLLPGGILEQHGPYLPSDTDGNVNEGATARLAEAIVALGALFGWSLAKMILLVGLFTLLVRLTIGAVTGYLFADYKPRAA